MAEGVEVRAGTECVDTDGLQMRRLRELLSSPQWPAAEPAPAAPSVSVSTPAVFESASRGTTRILGGAVEGRTHG